MEKNLYSRIIEDYQNIPIGNVNKNFQNFRNLIFFIKNDIK